KARQREEELELAAAAEAEDRRREEARAERLRKALIESQNFEKLAEAERPEEPDEVENSEDLIDRLRRFHHDATTGDSRRAKYVYFTGDVDPVSEMDQRDHYGRYANEFWQCVRVLDDYVEWRLNGGKGGVHAYLQDENHSGAR